MKRISYSIVSIVVIFTLYFGFKSLSSVNLPLIIDVDNELLHTNSFFQVEGEVSKTKINNYKGNYKDVVDFYVTFLNELRDNGADKVSGYVKKDVTRESLDSLSDLLKQGDIYWEFTELHSIYKYNDNYFLLLKHKIKDFYPLRYGKLIEKNGELKVIINDGLDFFQQTVMNWALYSRKNKFSIELPDYFERLATNIKSVFSSNVNEIEDGLFFSSSSHDLKPDDNFLEFINNINSENIVSLLESKFLSSASKKRIKSWTDASSYDLNHNIRGVVGWPIPEKISYISSLSLGSNCIVMYFNAGNSDDTLPLMACRGLNGNFELVNLLYNSNYNKLFFNMYFYQGIAAQK